MTTNQSEDEGLREELMQMWWKNDDDPTVQIIPEPKIDEIMALISQKIIEARVDELSNVVVYRNEYDTRLGIAQRRTYLTQGIKE